MSLSLEEEESVGQAKTESASQRMKLETLCVRASGQGGGAGGRGGWERPEALPRSSGCPEDSGCRQGVLSREGTCHLEGRPWAHLENGLGVVGGKFEAGKPLLGSRRGGGVWPGAEQGQGGTGHGDRWAGWGSGRGALGSDFGGRMDGGPPHQNREFKKEADLQEKAGSVWDKEYVSC